MISLPATVKIFLSTQPADMRKSFDGLKRLVEEFLEGDPLSGHLFVFRNRRGDRLKILYWDRDGLAIWYKRLEQGTFQFPTDLKPKDETQVGVEISVNDLSLLLGGIDLRSARRRKRFERPKNPK